MLATEVVFPSAPNWYSAHTIDASADGTLVLATNQSITVVDVSTRQVRGIYTVRGRITAVAVGEGLIFACSSERGVHAFSATSLATTGGHKDHHAEPCAVTVAPGYCITGDKRGTVCLWPISSASSAGARDGAARAGGFIRLCPIRQAVICLALAPALLSRVAVGYVGGSVVVVDVGSQAVVCNFRHRSAVQGLSWAPTGSCLATACQDQSVQLWSMPLTVGDAARTSSANADAEVCEQVAEVTFRAAEAPDARLWITVYAGVEGVVIYSGARGELFAWDAAKRKSHRAAQLHSRPIFGIRPVGEDHIATAGMDRHVVLWSLGKGAPQLKWRLCCLGGHLTAVRTDGTNLALLGCGDGNARVMDLMHREHRQHSWAVWRGIGGPSTSVCPGPRGFWAFGQQDGSFGVLAANAEDGPGKAEPLAAKNHPGPVTSLCWLRTPSFGVAAVATPTVDSAPALARSAGRGEEGSENDTPAADAGEMTGQDRGAVEEETVAEKGNGRKEPKSRAKKGAVSDKRGQHAQDVPILPPSGTLLVSVSAGHQVLVSHVAASGASSRVSPSASLSLQALSSVSPTASAAGAWPFPKGAGDVLVVAANHRAREDCLELNSLQLFHVSAEATDSLRLEAALPATGLEGGVTCMSLLPSRTAEECLVLCGNARGNLTALRLNWPPPSLGLPGKVPSASWPTLAQARDAHGKARGVADVQWRQASASDEISDILLSAGGDGFLKVWRLAGSPWELRCLHSLAGPLRQGTSGALCAACWDLSAGTNELAILAGGRDQIVFRWTPGRQGPPAGGVFAGACASAGSAGGAMKSQPFVGSSPASACLTAAGAGVSLANPAKLAGPPLVPSAPSGNLGRAPKTRTKQAASLLTLTSAALYQQSSRARALELVKLAPGARDLWPGRDALHDQSFSSAIFQNQQCHADRWLEVELEHKLQVGAAAEENGASFQRARLLKLWGTDVQEALALQGGEEGGASDAGVPAGWLWAALAPAAGRDAWESTLERILDELQRGAPLDSIHQGCAAALALERPEQAVRLYLLAELPADALLLARLRLPAHHPLVAHVYEQWAADLKRRNRHDQAAACRLAVGQLALALADLEELLTPAKAAPGPDPIRFAGAFAAACVAESIASARFRTSREKEDTEGENTAHEDGQSVEPAACDQADNSAIDSCVAYDHRRWWNRPELRAAVLAWKRCIVETLHAGQAPQALALARVEARGRPLSEGERFLRAALSGYASAVAWWVQLGDFDADPMAEGGSCGGENADAPLYVFLRQGQDVVVPEGDWDFEWRALTWLPAFSCPAAEDPLLVAAVELGRACASLASGCTRTASAAAGDAVAGDAPWLHLASSAAAVVGVAATVAATGPPRPGDPLPLRRHLEALARLVRRPRADAEAQVRGESVASTLLLAARLVTPAEGGELEASPDDPWSLLGRVLFGLPPASTSVAGVGSEVLRRGFRLLAKSLPRATPSATVARIAKAVAEGGLDPQISLRSVPLELEDELWRTAGACGLLLREPLEPLPAAARAPAAGHVTSVERSLQVVRRVHADSASPILVPMALAAWCSRLASKRGEHTEDYAVSEPEGDGADDLPSGQDLRSAWAKLLAALAEFAKEAEQEADADASWRAVDSADAAEEVGAEGAASRRGESEMAPGCEGILHLEKLEGLSFASRLALLQRGLDAAGPADAGPPQDKAADPGARGRAAAVAGLLALSVGARDVATGVDVGSSSI